MSARPHKAGDPARDGRVPSVSSDQTSAPASQAAGARFSESVKRRTYRPYTGRDIATTRRMLAEGANWTEVARAIGRDKPKEVATYLARKYGLRVRRDWEAVRARQERGWQQ
jgi:hypothetical protein